MLEVLSRSQGGPEFWRSTQCTLPTWMGELSFLSMLSTQEIQ